MAEAIEQLLNDLGDENLIIRRAAVIALGELKDPSTLDALIKLLKIEPDDDEYEIVRLEAVNSLAKIGDTRALPMLLQIACYGAPSRRTWEYTGLAFRKLALNAIETFGTIAIVPIASYISGVPQIDSRYFELVWLLRKLKNQSAVPYLVTELQRVHLIEDLKVFEYVLIDLGAKEEIVKRFIELFERLQDETDRIEMSQELVRLGDKRAIPYLAKALKNTEKPLLIKAIYEAMIELSENNEVSDELLQHFHNPESRWFYTTAAAFLSDRKVYEAIPEILNTLEQVDNREDLLTIHEALVNLGAESLMVEPLIDMLTNPLQHSLQGLVASLLGKTGDQRAIPAILQIRDKSSNRDDIYSFELALRQLGYNSDSHENS